MRHLSPLRAAMLVTSTLCLTGPAPLAAQDSAASPSFLESFLQDNLSGDNQFITVSGLSGAFSSQASIKQLTVADETGVWLELTDAELDWNRLALLRGEFQVNHLTAAEIKVLRAPQPLPEDPSLPSPETTPFQLPELPVSVELGEISLDRIQLGQPLLGFTATLNLNGNLKLADGSLKTELKVNRLDKPGDRLRLVAGYSNESRQIDLDLDLSEAADGLIATSLQLPTRPSLRLTAAGSGPVEDFTAKIALATNGSERLSGEVVLKARPSPDAQPDGATTDTTASTARGIDFAADLGGDIDVLLQPDFRPFFGPDLRLTLRGTTASDGAGLTLDSFALLSRALHLSGALSMTPAGQLDTANLRASITAPQGQTAVMLPLPGADTTLAQAEVLAQKTSNGPWSINADLRQLSHPQALISQGSISAQGLLQQGEGAPLSLDGDIKAYLTGLSMRDPGLAAAIGSNISLSTNLTSEGPGALALSDLLLQGDDFQASGDLAFHGLDAGLEVTADLRLGAASLARFSALADRPLEGALQAQIKGAFTPLSGAFDTDLALQGQGLTTGLTELDRLTGGSLALTFAGGRDVSGLAVEGFQLNSGLITAQASGRLNSKVGALSLNARLKDLNPLLPQMSGPLDLQGEVTRSGNSLSGTLRLEGPHASFADLKGQATLDGAADFTFDAALEELQRFVPDLPGTLTATGKVQRRDARWQINASTKAPAGAEAELSGSFDEASGKADITSSGTARLEGANPFIKPNLLKGTARFDLALKGSPSLAALRGKITTAGASLALPAAAQRLDDIGATVTLQDSRAQIEISARPRDGGSLRVSGPVALTPPFEGAINIAIQEAVLTDKLVYETILSGNLDLTGQLASNSKLSGRIDIGETTINLNTAGGSVSAAPIPPLRHINEPRAVRQTRARAGLIQSGASSGAAGTLSLDVIIDAPGRIYARGRGLNAELGGQVHLRGNTVALAPSGQISLVRGTFDILGRRLELDEGRITLLGDLKPYLEFRSSASTSTGTATLEITGAIDAPQIEVTSDPPRPSDQALALLLFGDNLDDLSPLALVRLANSALQLSGRGLGNKNALRDKTGADKVELGLDNIGSGLLGIGGYISDKAYTDFNVNTRGDSELSLNVDLTDNVTVTGTVDNQGESGFGLFFKRDY
ncbi:translocation/assembly module TamB domain-containing protein [Pseudophaeobacter flagellatus]|uniref:translocation/assembly module TamB domain-containing protein n=1 Tax=Pseudophaeobacter flagellatus TaxID=2899119 RepID=UPI001E445E03|nr:translocation/assembly module TamB domain-containing protein [Pseudophaeobacter flagellatus]MCD9148356.1 translocation/assembly module TamB domain-containing protein [Pseudophaeobacter flagellatus]